MHVGLPHVMVFDNGCLFDTYKLHNYLAQYICQT